MRRACQLNLRLSPCSSPLLMRPGDYQHLEEDGSTKQAANEIATWIEAEAQVGQEAETRKFKIHLRQCRHLTCNSPDYGLRVCVWLQAKHPASLSGKRWQAVSSALKKALKKCSKLTLTVPPRHIKGKDRRFQTPGPHAANRSHDTAASDTQPCRDTIFMKLLHRVSVPVTA